MKFNLLSCSTVQIRDSERNGMENNNVKEDGRKSCVFFLMFFPEINKLVFLIGRHIVFPLKKWQASAFSLS